MIKNKSGYELIEYIPCDEHEIVNYENVTSAGVIFKVNNSYLIGFNDWRMQWELPVGGIEKGESARQAAIRELFEETHQKVDDVQFKGLFKKKRPTGEIVVEKDETGVTNADLLQAIMELKDAILMMATPIEEEELIEEVEVPTEPETYIIKQATQKEEVVVEPKQAEPKQYFDILGRKL